MNLQLNAKTFAVGGATSGLGRAVVVRLIEEGARVIGIARTQAKLEDLATELGDAFVPYVADLTDATAVKLLGEYLTKEDLHGLVLNAGGPPTGRVEELSMTDWDQAYALTLRWKIQLTAAVLPTLRANAGRLLYLESVSVKQPIDNLVLSNALRAAVAGYVKTLSREVGDSGLTVNILAPGYHATRRINDVLEKSAKIQGLSLDEIKQQFAAEVPLGRIGDPADFAAMAAFLLSPLAGYISGQTINVDGGIVRHLHG